MSILVNSENIEEFLDRKCMLKAILFTKKVETPSLWLKLVDSFSGRVIFGEVRHSEETVIARFGITQDSLPKIIAFREADGTNHTVLYHGQIDFERIKEFFLTLVDGGVVALDLMGQLDCVRRENRCLQESLAKEKEATQLALADAARIKLGQVGQVEAVRRGLETEIQEMKQHEMDLRASIAAELECLKSENSSLRSENILIQEKLQALESANCQVVVALTASNFDLFLNSASRPLKAVLFSTKVETPVLWQQLAQSHSLTTAFGLVKHTENDILLRFKLRPEALPRIYLFGNGRDTPMPYDGPVNTESIATFLKDAVEGGPACIEMRRLLHVGLRRGSFL
jgi:DNA-directed RNA polymerase subunit H (RpoH/RPB5)